MYVCPLSVRHCLPSYILSCLSGIYLVLSMSCFVLCTGSFLGVLVRATLNHHIIISYKFVSFVFLLVYRQFALR